MSKPRKRIRGHTRHCGQKQKFATEDDARRAGRFDGQVPYKCRKCGSYHFGHGRGIK